MIDPEQQPSPEPGAPSSFPSDLDDPYSLWVDLPPGALLPYSAVLLGFSSWLRGHYRPMWIEQTTHSNPWHLDRWSGLYGWCQHEAEARLRERYQERYNDADFAVIHLGEAIMNGKDDALKNPFWTPVFVYHQLRGDKPFFQYVTRSIERKAAPQHGWMRLLAILFDRGYVPFEYWTSSAIAEFWRLNVNSNAPTPGLIRKWLERMGLNLASPPIVTGFGRSGITRFDEGAAKLHGLPKS